MSNFVLSGGLHIGEVFVHVLTLEMLTPTQSEQDWNAFVLLLVTIYNRLKINFEFLNFELNFEFSNKLQVIYKYNAQSGADS